MASRSSKNIKCPYCDSKEAFESLPGVIRCCGCGQAVGMWQRDEIKAKVAAFLKGIKPTNGFAKYQLDQFKSMCVQFGED